MIASPAAAAQPLLASSADQLLAVAALAVFPTIEDRHDAHTATLCRAVAFIDDNAHRDIAAACSVTIRAVQLAFQRHLGITPMAGAVTDSTYAGSAETYSTGWAART